MKKIDEHGNIYKLTHTDSGVPTFEHIQTGQLLHSHIGPYEEAWKLYVKNSGVTERKGSCTVYDLGLGCGSQLIAFRDAFLQNTALPHMSIVSFDLETLGLSSLIDNLDHFPFAKHHEKFLRAAVQEGVYKEQLPDGRTFDWRFVEGDFVKTVLTPGLPLANVVCYDFFSVSAHPHLWTYDIMHRLWELCADDGVILTYSSATSVRAAMLASGFFVGFCPNSSETFRMTIASKQAQKIEVPLDARWLQKFERSSIPYLDIESDETKSHIRQAVFDHPQFNR